MLEWRAQKFGHDPLASMRRNRHSGGALLHEQSIGKLRLSIDPMAEVSGSWTSPIGRVVEVELKLSSPPRWIAVHIDMPEVNFAQFKWVGFALRHGASNLMPYRAAIRSYQPRGAAFHDLFFPRELIANAASADHFDLIDPSQKPDLPANATRRELVLFLSAISDVRWSLHDLRFVYL